MSSLYVRDQIENYLKSTFPEETILDLSGEFETLQNFLARNNVKGNGTWVGLQFVGNDEEPITIAADGVQGKYREVGACYIHVVSRSKIGVVKEILPRTEAIKNALRSRRIGEVLILSVTPANFDQGATIDFEGGWTSGTIIVAYQNDVNL